MSRQIQIRRGTTAEHESFTGAAGEITMDITEKTLRIHDGETAGGIPLARQNEIPDLTGIDYVIETRFFSSGNSMTWYRKYKSGWVEQGGLSSSNKTVVFPVKMADSNYFWLLNTIYNNSAATMYFELGALSSRTATGFVKDGNAQTFNWQVKGMAAK